MRKVSVFGKDLVCLLCGRQDWIDVYHLNLGKLWGASEWVEEHQFEKLFSLSPKYGT